MSLRVVFDTNILFSAVGWDGNPAKCVELAQTGRIEGVTCAEILDALADKLSSKLKFTDDQVATVLASLLAFLEVESISGTMTNLQADPDDDKILECAVVAKATAIVTGDRKHLLPLRQFQGIRIVTATELLAMVASSQAQ